jgi:hypothetical protein
LVPRVERLFLSLQYSSSRQKDVLFEFKKYKK